MCDFFVLEKRNLFLTVDYYLIILSCHNVCMYDSCKRITLLEKHRLLTKTSLKTSYIHYIIRVNNVCNLAYKKVNK